MKKGNWQGGGVRGQALFCGVQYTNEISRATAVRTPDGKIHTKVEKIQNLTDTMDSAEMSQLTLCGALGLEGGFLREALRDLLADAVPVLLPVWGLPFWLEFPVRLAAYVAVLMILRVVSPGGAARNRYHGAEHKVLNCARARLELTPENAKAQSPIHDACGTVEGAWMVFLSTLLASLIVTPWWPVTCVLAVAAKVILKACLSKLWEKTVSGKKNAFARAVRRMGMAAQRLWTSEPRDAELEVALAAFKLSAGQQVKLRAGSKTIVVQPGLGMVGRRKR